MLQLHFLPLLLIVGLAGIFHVRVRRDQYVIDGVRQLQVSGHAHARPD